MTGFQSGFIALVGRPNAGKSTLINRLTGHKIAIVSDKPQTTRNSIRGVYTDEKMQAVFIDTPGVHKPKYQLGQRMMAEVDGALSGCDLVFYLTDVTQPFGAGERYILQMLAETKRPVFLILNKIDLLEKDQLLPLIANYTEKYPFAEVVPLSALTGDNSDAIKPLLLRYLPQGPQYYPEDAISDFPENMLAAELIREQVLRLTSQEVPHSVAVTVNTMEERSEDLLYIEAVIYVERDSQKGILIGKQGAMLKKIGSAARLEIQRLFACRVYLDLRVKSRRDWRDNSGLLENMFLQE